MKIIALGDIHGRTNWRDIVAKTEFDKIVFIGDYFDTHEDISAEQQKANFEDIIEYKKANMEKVILLLGNHDYHYLSMANEKYKGFQEAHKTDIQEMLQKALRLDLIQMCFVFHKFIFSHAGVTKTWLNSNGYTAEEPVDLFINNLFKYQPLAFKFTRGMNNSGFGDDVCQTPIWVRPQSLRKDCLDNYVQVVGHTMQDKLNIVDDKICFIDTLGTTGQFLSIENDEMFVVDAIA